MRQLLISLCQTVMRQVVYEFESVLKRTQLGLRPVFMELFVNSGFAQNYYQ